jgi:hypothetical protein
MRRSLAALLFLMLPPATGWALAVDSTTGTSQWCQTCASKTYSFNNSAGTLLTCAAWLGAGSANFTSLTHNGTTVTPDKVEDYALGGSHTRVHHLLSPVTGPANVVLTMSVAVNSIGVSCTSFTGNDAVTPIIHTGGAFNDNSNSPGGTNSCIVPMTAGTSGNMMVGAAQWGSAGACTPAGCSNGETVTPGSWQSGGPNNLDASGGGDNGGVFIVTSAGGVTSISIDGLILDWNGCSAAEIASGVVTPPGALINTYSCLKADPTECRPVEPATRLARP